MKLLKDSHKLLNNKFILYFVLLLALADVIFLATGREYASVAIFILTGFVSSFFSKNMIVILCIAMTVANVLRFGTGGRQFDEGFEEGEQNNTEDEDPPTTKENLTKATPSTIDPNDIEKFSETMDKIEAYEPAIKAMDSLFEKLYELTGHDEKEKENKK